MPTTGDRDRAEEHYRGEVWKQERRMAQVITCVVIVVVVIGIASGGLSIWISLR